MLKFLISFIIFNVAINGKIKELPGNINRASNYAEDAFNGLASEVENVPNKIAKSKKSSKIKNTIIGITAILSSLG